MAIKISHLPDKIVVDDEIVLVAKNAENYQDFVDIATANKKHLSKFLPWAENIPDEGSFTHYSESANNKAENKEANWSIYYKSVLSGAIGLMNRGNDPTILEIGYWLAFDKQSKGIMTRSVVKLCEVAFSQTDAEAIEIACDPLNTLSAKVATNSGFTFNRTEDHFVPSANASSIHDVYRLER